MSRIKYFLLVCFIPVICSCKKSSTDIPVVEEQANVAVSAVSPLSAAFDALITITGTGFSTVLTDNKVTINSVNAVVTAATATQLTVKVPKGAGSGAISVQVKSKTVAAGNFTYVLTATVSTLAGNGVKGFADGPAATAQFSRPTGIAVDLQGNIYIADVLNSRIRKLAKDGTVSTYAGSATKGMTNGAANLATFNSPTSIAVDSKGNVFVADGANNVIRQISTAGVVSTFAGSGTVGVNDGMGTAANISYPIAICIDKQDNLYVTDANSSIRKITPGGMVSTIAGKPGMGGYADGKGMAAIFNNPLGIGTDAAGNIYVADTSNDRIRKIDAAGNVTTITGSDNPNSLIADGSATVAKLGGPCGVVVDNTGNLYIAEYGSFRIRKVTADGTVSTFAGTGAIGYLDGPVATAKVTQPYALTMDAAGSIYIADQSLSYIRKITFE